MSSQRSPSPPFESTEIPPPLVSRTDRPTNPEDEHPDYQRIQAFSFAVQRFTSIYSLSGYDHNIDAAENLLDTAVRIHFTLQYFI